MMKDELEKLIAELPAIAELKARRDTERKAAEAAKRSALIDEIEATERAIEKTEAQHEKLMGELTKAEATFVAARSKVQVLSGELSSLRGTYNDRHNRLTAECGNRAVHDGLTNINAWMVHLGNLESRAKARVADAVDVGVFKRKKFPSADHELAEIQRRIAETKKAYGEVEAMTLSRANPETIASAVQKITARIIDDAFIPFPTEAIRPQLPITTHTANQ